jgi:triosephosphate isomerase
MRLRKPVVVGNWKMNGSVLRGRELARVIAAGLTHEAALAAAVDWMVCPAFPYLTEVLRAIDGAPLSLAAQNVSAHPEGAHTGEVSAAMLLDVGCRFTLVGHSERRNMHGEIDAVVAAKAKAALAAGLGVIVCVGESLAEREQGLTAPVIARQLGAVLPQLAGLSSERVMMAYEPVWAIGTGRTASPDQAAEVHRQIRGAMAAAGLPADEIRVLYGGSVKASNASALLAQADIDGALVGGASLDAGEFLAIGRAALPG